MWENYLRLVKEPLKRTKGKSIQGSHRAGNSAAPKSYNILIQGPFCRVLRKNMSQQWGIIQFFSSVTQSCLTLWTAAHQASLSITNSRSLLKFMSFDSVMSSNHPSFVIPSSSCPQSFPASGSFQMSQFFASGGQSIGVSASSSVLPVNIQDWFPSGWTGWISLQSKGLSTWESSLTPQLKSINSSVLSFFYSSTLTSIHDYWENQSFD